MKRERSSTAFGVWLGEAMAKRGSSIRKSARGADLSPATLDNTLHGASLPDPPTCRKLAEYFGVDLDYLLQLAGHRPPSAEPLDGLDPELRFHLPKLRELSRQDQLIVKDLIVSLHGARSG